MTHAFFKALLFLAAGIVIEALHHEHDIFRMGGLRKELPVAFWTFLIGGCALAGLPLITAGFYSKDLILWSAAALALLPLLALLPMTLGEFAVAQMARAASSPVFASAAGAAVLLWALRPARTRL